MKNPFRALQRAKSNLEMLQERLMQLSIARAVLAVSGPRREVQLVNVLMRVTLLLCDCLTLFEDLKCSRDGQRQRVYARVFAVIAVDALDYLGNPLGSVGRELATIAKAAQRNEPLAQSKMQLAQFRRNHERFLRGVRNTLIAHSGADGQRQLQALGDFDLRHAIVAFQEFLAMVDQVQVDLGALLEVSRRHEWPGHMSSRGER